MAFQAGLYWIIDPLCGWSYGALPLLNRVAEDFPAQHILPGGLFIGPHRRQLDASWLAHVNEHDARLAQTIVTGCWPTARLSSTPCRQRADCWRHSGLPCPAPICTFSTPSSGPGIRTGKTSPTPTW